MNINSEILVVYDNTCKPNANIKGIIGSKRFDGVIFKGKNLKSRFYEILENNSITQKPLEINETNDIYDIISLFEGVSLSKPVVHFYSNFIVNDQDEFSVLLKKAKYINHNIIVKNESVCCLLFKNITEYIKYLRISITNQSSVILPDSLDALTMESDVLKDISVYSNFIHFISGGFDARYFNSLQGDESTVIKTSTVKKKIKSEYQFYHLLPDHMKQWFVLPYNYQETDNTASYTMERYNMSDMAIKWIHNSVDIDSFSRLLKKVFSFVDTRSRKDISMEEYKYKADDLYLNKLYTRINELKTHELFPVIESYISSGTSYASIDEIIEKYTLLYKKVTGKKKFDPVAVIGHGDLCFSNMLYDHEMSLLRLIDPKGAETEAGLWTDPYYDLAKLSHSICGLYDFFNSGLYDINLDDDLKFKLNIDYDNAAFVDVFKTYLSNSKFDYLCVRVFEASLFLSMLPLHMDYPTKVFGFLLNAMNIMDEVEKNV